MEKISRTKVVDLSHVRRRNNTCPINAGWIYVFSCVYIHSVS